ncbi:MAG: LapA family protein [Candidatus Accumulibacter sp.]|uniref:LapA family protein n=1 Tax=Accumulibacter sp. TaxID=2053492 RepID=UPI0019E77EFA|nr:LapA family protein [Accumulibacter sp.]MBE2260823.1 LapA family protein [Paracoccaceae bacterium]MCB1942791.1 LapA family protein [Accumulibacter sp.]MCP5247265.1 LapA family protein [Accumulibacter sp.]
MKFRILFLLLMLGAIAGFSALNWDAFVTPTTLSVGLTDVQAPIGVIMLGALCLLTAYFLAFVIYVQASALFDSRRHAQELQANRELADKAEASRFTELRGFITVELQQLARQQANMGSSAAVDSAVLARLDRVEKDLLAAVEQLANTLGAALGELEDRLERSERGLPPR